MSIVKPIRNRSGDFKNAIDYALGEGRNKGREVVSYVNWRNVISSELAARQMELTASKYSGKSTSPVFHCTINFVPSEMVTPEQADEAVAIVLKNMHMEDAQVVWSIHESKKHKHIHLVVNKIDPQTHRMMRPHRTNGFYYNELELSAAQIDVVQGREHVNKGRYFVVNGEVVLNPEVAERERKKEKQRKVKEVETKALSNVARTLEAHRGVKSWERVAMERVGDLFQTSESWQELHEKLAQKGMWLEKRGSGTVIHLGEFEGKEIAIKTTSVDKDAGLKKLRERLGEWKAKGRWVKVTNVPLTLESLSVTEQMDIQDKGFSWGECGSVALSVPDMQKAGSARGASTLIALEQEGKKASNASCDENTSEDAQTTLESRFVPKVGQNVEYRFNDSSLGRRVGKVTEVTLDGVRLKMSGGLSLFLRYAHGLFSPTSEVERNIQVGTPKRGDGNYRGRDDYRGR